MALAAYRQGVEELKQMQAGERCGGGDREKPEKESAPRPLCLHPLVFGAHQPT